VRPPVRDVDARTASTAPDLAWIPTADILSSSHHLPETPLKRFIAFVAALPIACVPAGFGSGGAVLPGIDVVLDQDESPLHGRRVGLITNQTGTDAQGRSTIDRLHEEPDVDLVALFSPEHGIRGDAEPGERITSGLDERTGLPIHSLYGEIRKPTAEMLEGVDVLAFDIQDIGARQYTYISTMALGMHAAAEHGIPFVVLDRPNPIGGVAVEGNILDPAFASFVGMYPIAARHGMTVGELARLFNATFGIGADLTVIPASGWTREAYFDETGLPWVNPSPNIRRLEAAIHYPGTVFLEGTNLSEGRGTDIPFEQTGAPWMDAAAVADEMNGMRLPGVNFVPVRIRVSPDTRKFAGDTIPGVRLIVTDRETYRPVRTGLLLIDAVRRRHPDEFEWSATINRLAGTDRVRAAIEAGNLQQLLEEWDADAERFREIRRPYLIYE
jgi:uncharacterized protein YbbC (DUF1343 family)